MESRCESRCNSSSSNGTESVDRGPLHGVPVSLKDQFDIKGVELNMGYGAYLGRISPENAAIVDLLLALGAIIYVRTNIPQTLMVRIPPLSLTVI